MFESGERMTEQERFERKHLSRNVPKDFDACLERERLKLLGDGRKRRKPEPHIGRMLKVIRPDVVPDDEEQRLYDALTEIRLRYLVLSKTLDQSIPPTPIMKALKSLQYRVDAAVRVLADEDRDAMVRDLLGLRPEEPFPESSEDFQNANTIAERAAIARQVVAGFSKDIDQMATFFDYKAGMTPRGNQTQFGLIYAVNALAAFFERETALHRSAAINRNIPRKGEDDPAFTGPFLGFMTEFFHLVDDAQLSHLETTSFRDRVRRLTIRRKNDPTLHEVLNASVNVERMLEFMKRAERIR